MTTEAGNYATYQDDDGRWYYHPADLDWLAFSHNRDFSRAYATEAEAMAGAELQEQMDDDDEFEEVILYPETGTARP